MLSITQNTSFSYTPHHTLFFPQYTIACNTVLGIQGSNGVGKTTLLKLLAGILFPQTGAILYNGDTITPKNAIKIRKDITLLLQDAYVFKRTVEENLCYPLRIRKLPQPKALLLETLNTVGLSEKFLKKDAHKLSGGERQKLALGMRLLCNPKILLLDEPTASIDTQSTNTLAQLIQQKKEKITFIIVSHDTPWLHSVATHMLKL